MSEWIKWEGGECPVPDYMLVEYKLGYSDVAYAPNKAGLLSWEHGHDADITEYRIMQQKTLEEAYEDAARPISDNALNEQVGGSHYLQFEIQPIEFINANKLDFLSGNVVKYISRHRMKGGAEDVNKAIHYCKLILEMQYGD